MVKMIGSFGLVLAACALSGADLRVEKLGEDLFRVRTQRDGKCSESGLNRYGILQELPVLASGTDLGVLPVKPEVRTVGKGFEIKLPLKPETCVYGLGDVCRTNVMRRGAAYEMWVRNVTCYAPIPMALTSDGWGVLMNTTWRHTFDVGAADPNALTLSAREGEVDFYLFTGRDYAALLEAYTRVAGRPALLPIWGYGFTYVCNEDLDAFKVLEEARTFRKEDFPCDVIGLEPGWMSKRYDYSLKKDWNSASFPFPSWAPNGASGTWGATEATIWPQALANMGYKLSLWLCCDYDLFRYEEQCAAGVARKLGRQSDLRAGIPEFWEDDRIVRKTDKISKRKRPEEDFEEGKLPWFEHLKKFVDQGAQCFKLDGALQVTQQAADRKWANGMTTEEAHNLYPVVYGKQMARGYEEYTGKRAMVYSAGGYAGVQQFVATWAGDTGGGVKPLASLLNHAFSGHPNQSCDMQIGDSQSRHFGFLQTWSQQNNWAYWKEAWYMNPERQEAFRAYGRLRYRLVPYLYTAAAKAARTGWPVTRPLVLEYPDMRAYDQTITTYKLGDALLVSAFAAATEIPPGTWYDWWTGEEVKGPAKRAETITERRGGGLYVKAGAIIPTWPKKNHLDKGWNEEVVFEVWPGATGVSELYEDDGTSLGYRTGEYALTPLALTREADGSLTFAVGRRTGSFKGMPATRRMSVRFHLPTGLVTRDLGAVGADGAQVTVTDLLRTGPDRVKTPLKVDLKRVGTIRPRSTDEIRDSNWVIGCETLDRDYADFNQYKRFLKPLGIKHLRLQGGWAKCEKTKGVYDFAWLDEQVDYARSVGINPTIETSYGNPIYEGGGEPNLAGGFPTGKGLEAWDNWVRALAKHFRGRVRDWLMWNEPDNALYLDPKMPELTAALDVRTAKIILAEIPDARIGAICASDYRNQEGPEGADHVFGGILDFMGKDRDLFAWIVYHSYARCPDEAYPHVEHLKTILEKRGVPATKLWQGECGCPSQATSCGALGKVRWTEYSQAKWDMRRMLGDLGHDVRSLVYSMSDLQYGNYLGKGKVRHNAKGLVRTNRNREVIAVKRAYYAVQNVASVFDDTLVREPKPRFYNDDPTLAMYEFVRDRRRVLAFWTFAESCAIDPRDKGVPMAKWKYPSVVSYVRPGDSFETAPRVFRLQDAPPLEDPVWVDLMTGGVYEIPPENVIVNSEGVTYLDVPVYDSPCLLAEKAALEIE